MKLIISDNFRHKIKYQNSRNSRQWERNYSMRTDRQTWQS